MSILKLANKINLSNKSSSTPVTRLLNKLAAKAFSKLECDSCGHKWEKELIPQLVGKHRVYSQHERCPECNALVKNKEVSHGYITNPSRVELEPENQSRELPKKLKEEIREEILDTIKNPSYNKIPKFQRGDLVIERLNPSKGIGIVLDNACSYAPTGTCKVYFQKDNKNHNKVYEDDTPFVFLRESDLTKFIPELADGVAKHSSVISLMYKISQWLGPLAPQPEEPAMTKDPLQSEMPAAEPAMSIVPGHGNTIPEKPKYPHIPSDVQKMLNSLGRQHGENFNLVLDGSLGPETRKAINWFRNSYHVPGNFNDKDVIEVIKNTFARATK